MFRSFSGENKISEIIIDVGGDLITCVDSLEEMQSHLDLVCNALNMALYPPKIRQKKLKEFITTQKPYAPSPEALKGLEWEFRRIMKQKDKKYPSINNKIVNAVAIEKAKDDYVIRALFEP